MARTSGVPNFANGLKNLVKSDTFAGVTTGDRVRVIFTDPHDILMKFAKIKYEFVAHVTNIENGKQWVDLWGGPTKHEAWLCVKPNQIVKVDTRRKQ